ncbi:UNVERIFIED_CONTAM: hypothetical protein FKN15_068634 [Acipenser sinensis]
MDRNALTELLEALESRRDAEERRREERYTALIERDFINVSKCCEGTGCEDSTEHTPELNTLQTLHLNHSLTCDLSSKNNKKMTQADSVTQHFKSIVVKETYNSTIHCQYETASSPTPYWYIQDPNQAPQLILSEFTQHDNILLRFRNRFSVSHDKKNENKTFHLNITAAVLSDSATDFCALSPTL